MMRYFPFGGQYVDAAAMDGLIAGYQADPTPANRNKVVVANFNLVGHIVRQLLCNNKHDWTEAFNAAMPYLVRAVELYEPAAGKWTPYAGMTIRSAIQRWCYEKNKFFPWKRNSSGRYAPQFRLTYLGGTSMSGMDDPGEGDGAGLVDKADEARLAQVSLDNASRPQDEPYPETLLSILEPLERSLVERVVFGEEPISAIAKELHLSRNTIALHVKNALAQLRQKYEQEAA